MDTLEFLYRTIPGRMLLKPLTSRAVSRLAGAFLDTRASAVLIGPFVRSQQIDLSDYDLTDVKSFNAFFCRKLLPGKRPVEQDPALLASPCDGLLSAYPIREGLIVPVKQSRYAVADLLGDAALADRYEGGLCLVFRLCVHHYHRYAYVESGKKSKNRFLPGKLHTVRPVALREVPVFTENCRSYTVIRTDRFGTVLQMEVGAMLVGRICNQEEQESQVLRGQEKGMFQYGGSTILVLLQKDKARLLPQVSAAFQEEVPVQLGQAIAQTAAGEGRR